MNNPTFLGPRPYHTHASLPTPAPRGNSTPAALPDFGISVSALVTGGAEYTEDLGGASRERGSSDNVLANTGDDLSWDWHDLPLDWLDLLPFTEHDFTLA